MSEHTKGPWEFAGEQLNNCLVVSAPGRRAKQMVALVPLVVGYLADPTPEASANARLMASAPELLAALKRLLDERCPFVCDTETCECGENGDGRDEKGNVCEHIQAARAIAKAEGK